MIKTKGRLYTAAEVAFCFLASVIIAIAALNIGLKTEPGKILPTGLSMRSGEMCENITRGIDLALEDISQIRAGNASSGIMRLLTFVHPDLFFYLALLVPEAAAKTVLIAGFYVRFGLCCAAMYYFLSKHLRLTRLFSALLAVMYAFSSQIVFTAQFSSVMNMAVMIPLVMSAFDSYLQKRTWKAFALVCLASFGLSVSGGFGVISGIPAMILMALLMCNSLYSTFKMAFTSWLKLLGGLITGLAMSMVFVLPGLLSMKFDVDVSESFKNSRVTYTFFELIRGTFVLRSGSIYQNTAPLFYVGILTLVAVIAFALNEKIPVRLKVAAAVIAAVFHISCCSSFVNETVSVYGAAPVLNSSRLICLEAVVFFVAGIGLKNAKSLTRGDHIAACLIPLFFLIMSGSSTSGTSFASPIVISTFLAIICESVLVYAAAKDRLTSKAKYAVLFIVFVLVGVNTAFIMFNNSIQKNAAEEYFAGSGSGSLSGNLIIDKGIKLPMLNDGETYLVVPSDLSSFLAGDTAVDGLNYIAMKETGEKAFEEIFLKISDKREIKQEGLDTFLLNGGFNDFAFSPFNVEPGERIFILCTSSGGATVDIFTSEGESGRAFTGPFLTEIGGSAGEVTLKIHIESEGEDACRIAFYKLNGSVINDVLTKSGSFRSSGFIADVKNVDGICSIVMPFAYDGTKVRIDGKPCDTYDFCGKLAVTFDCGGRDAVEVSVSQNPSGILPGALISAGAAVCLIAIPLFHMYNKKKIVTGEGTETDAKQKDN